MRKTYTTSGTWFFVFRDLKEYLVVSDHSWFDARKNAQEQSGGRYSEQYTYLPGWAKNYTRAEEARND